MTTPHATRQAVGRSAQALRRAELAQIHIAKAQLRLTKCAVCICISERG